MSAKAKAFKNLYLRGRITKDAVKKAYDDGVITDEEYIWIVGVE